MTGPAAPRRTRAVPTRPTKAQLEDRIQELEARLLELEGQRRRKEAAQMWFRGMVPPEAGHHFKTAAREQLLGMRALVDHWIGRLDQASRSEQRETIPIE